MGWGFSKPININGFTNLYAAMQTAGFTEGPIAQGDVIVRDNDAAVDFYVHFNASRLAAPSTGTDGVPVGPTAGDSVFYTFKKRTDLSTVWLYSASAITANVGVTPETSLI